MKRKKKFNLHICSPWSGACHMEGIRLNILTPWRFIYVGFFGGEVYSERNGKWKKIVVTKLGE